jgi:hypothetical protein
MRGSWDGLRRPGAGARPTRRKSAVGVVLGLLALSGASGGGGDEGGAGLAEGLESAASRLQLGYRPTDDAETWASEVNSAEADPTESGKGPQGGSYAR